MDETRPPGLRFDQIFVPEVEFKHRDDFLEHPPNTPVEVQVVLEWRTVGKSGDDRVVFFMRMKTLEDPAPLYFASVTICAVISRVQGEENMEPFEFAESAAPAALFPYLREVVFGLTLRGRFGPLNLPPINTTLGRTQPAPSTSPAPKKPRRAKKKA